MLKQKLSILNFIAYVFVIVYGNIAGLFDQSHVFVSGEGNQILLYPLEILFVCAFFTLVYIALEKDFKQLNISLILVLSSLLLFLLFLIHSIFLYIIASFDLFSVPLSNNIIFIINIFCYLLFYLIINHYLTKLIDFSKFDISTTLGLSFFLPFFLTSVVSFNYGYLTTLTLTTAFLIVPETIKTLINKKKMLFITNIENDKQVRNSILFSFVGVAAGVIILIICDILFDLNIFIKEAFAAGREKTPPDLGADAPRGSKGGPKVPAKGSCVTFGKGGIGGSARDTLLQVVASAAIDAFGENIKKGGSMPPAAPSPTHGTRGAFHPD